MSDPHFNLHTASGAAPHAVLAQLVVRAADCLRAIWHEPTAQAGLNETRFNVLELLRRAASGSCSQSEIAAAQQQLHLAAHPPVASTGTAGATAAGSSTSFADTLDRKSVV